MFTRPEQLVPGENLAGFHSGDPVVDGWARGHAAHAKARGTAVVYVVRNEAGDVAGFYTLSSHSIARSSVAGGWLRRNVPEEIPVVLLGMLGVDERCQGCGLGGQLLRDAVLKAVKVADIVGAKAIVVDPSSEAARSFYRKYGFKEIPGSDRMYASLRPNRS